MATDQAANKIGFKYSSAYRSIAQDVFIDYPLIVAAKPGANGYRESHLPPRENRFGQYALHALAQNVLRGPTSQLESLGKLGGKLNQFMVQKGHATFDRSR